MWFWVGLGALFALGAAAQGIVNNYGGGGAGGGF